MPSVADPSTLNCTVATCNVTSSFYNYRIDIAANIAFLILFSLLLIAYLTIWLLTRRCHFFSTAMVLGVLTEVIGYAGRIWSYYDQWNETAYFIQIICLTLAPAFLSAGVYICLASVAIIYGRENSRIKPIWYTIIFMPCDAISLLLQAIGGGIAASALAEEDLDGINEGNDILIAGLSWQVFTLACFLALSIDLALHIRRRVRQHGSSVLSQDPAAVAVRRSKLFKAFLVALGLVAVLIFWRCAFRVAELSDGFFGPITYKQGLFIGFEGVLIVLAATALAILHPAVCMGAALKK